MEPKKIDPKPLAQLAMRCRMLRTMIEESAANLPSQEDTPFLSNQLDTQIEALESALGQLKEVRGLPAKKRGGLLRMFGRKEMRDAAETKQQGWGFEGNAWTISVQEILGFLASSGKTGVLWVDAGEESFMIEFTHGDMVRATSNRTPEGLRLGEILVQQGALQQESLGELIEKAAEADSHLGSYLVNEKHIQSDELYSALATQVQGLFNRLMATEDALYRFHEGIYLSDAQDLNLNITGLLLECARLQDEQQRLAS